ncbi:hypothetical protein RRG08_004756 [Elysia crispata]|uniref:Uncharacterized protein n=1 Tax=Elysia crispata TaxID=231223 RepID=A0AAE1DZ82_9GAST|nr:hypothetical protein RRG08_004756 [Elysia crispata]
MKGRKEPNNLPQIPEQRTPQGVHGMRSTSINSVGIILVRDIYTKGQRYACLLRRFKRTASAKPVREEIILVDRGDGLSALPIHTRRRRPVASVHQSTNLAGSLTRSGRLVDADHLCTLTLFKLKAPYDVYRSMVMNIKPPLSFKVGHSESLRFRTLKSKDQTEGIEFLE